MKNKPQYSALIRERDVLSLQKTARERWNNDITEWDVYDLIDKHGMEPFYTYYGQKKYLDAR